MTDWLITCAYYSDSTEVNPSDNHASISIPVHYDSEIALSREANLNFYVVDMDNEVKTTVNTFNDIGPELKFSLKVRNNAQPGTPSLCVSQSVVKYFPLVVEMVRHVFSLLFRFLQGISQWILPTSQSHCPAIQQEATHYCMWQESTLHLWVKITSQPVSK